MATTTNFGWETPDDTDLVKDGAAAIRTALGGVDTSFVDLKGGTTGQILSKASGTDLDFAWASAGMTNPMTTTGDIIYSSSGSTPARLGIGTTGQVLNVTGGVPAWTTPASGGSLTLLSTTTLSGASTTVSSINQTYKNLYVEIANVAGIDSFVRFRPNDANLSDLIYVSTSTVGTPSNAGSIMGASSGPGPTLFTATIFNYAATTEQKNVQYATNGGASVFGAGFIKSNTEVTSIVVSVGSGSFSGGTIRVYGVK